MEPQVINIPANFTDAGKIFGMFEIRNTIEMLVFIAPVILIVFGLVPVGLTAKIIISAVIIVPLGGFSLMGIRDYSLLTFVKIYLKWRKNRRILTYKGGEAT